jgi:glutamyl-tRNA synthetase
VADGPRVRIAPSPTGYFHVGTARTALFNWLFARQRDGTFILRIEDTDAARNRAEHIEGIMRAMEWLGLDWDEGPYFQSQRGPLYADAVLHLVASGAAYACDCPPGAVAERARARGDKTSSYDGYCRDRGLEPLPGSLLRFRTPDTGQTSFDDVIRGTVTVDNAEIEDFGVRKSNGDPLFILANVVDDADMRMTHVIRGEDHVTNTTKYVMLWRALGYGSLPTFAHLPLLYNDARKKLSKRRDKVAVEDFRDEGYLPEAMRNYLALLGWSPGENREILTVDQLVAEFRLEDVKSAGAIFDERKLQAINAEYMRALPVAELVERSQAWLRDRWEPLAAPIQERSRTLADVYDLTDFLYLPHFVIDAGDWDRGVRKYPAFGAVLDAATSRYSAMEEWTPTAIRDATVAAGEDAGLPKPRDAQAPIRLAVMGRAVGLPLWESLAVLGQDTTMARLADARRRLDSST